MDDVSPLDLLLTSQDRVCTITNAIIDILGQVEVTVIDSSKSRHGKWTKAGCMIVVLILNLLGCCGLALYGEQFAT